MSLCTARITNLDPSTTEADLLDLLQQRQLPVSSGQSRVSLATSISGEKVATVTFRDEKTLDAAMKLAPQDRQLRDRFIGFDTKFDGFTTLSDGDEIDIVALHGLNGHAFKSWQYAHQSDCFMWLRDVLPEHFPSARILTYGYNAAVVSDVSAARLRNFAETFLENLKRERDSDTYRSNPLIIMMHSLGGLVIKQALIVARQNSGKRYEDVLDSLRCMIFFGTPHQGVPGATRTRIAGNLLRAVGIEARTDLIRELEPTSTALFDLTEDFRHAIEDLGTIIYTFFEEKRTRTRGGLLGRDALVVPEKSAILGVTRERKASINADHINICKFSGPGDNAYGAVRKVIREAIQEFTPTVTTRDADAQPPPPEGLKYINLKDPNTLSRDDSGYPVLVWGPYTYWALSHDDNRYGMTILAYDGRGRLVQRWEKIGARYIVSISLDRGTVKFIGQAELSIKFTLNEIRIGNF
ncbi:hypothetical protein CERSUDRAFT_118443 [Gelatoporia subvermispora B]|uniref:DUF676 domain-containing protein n=1 Tax=Ceriporiopsis subvermispora (strain B) TaxID=914234 RepID=M2R2C8_CERS8|nr:hypothetical protein CERSUDRAFT_118443 [Gelatoporia subvermispora B]